MYLKLPGSLFPNILLVIPNSGLIQVQSSKTLEASTVLGIIIPHTIPQTLLLINIQPQGRSLADVLN